MKMHQDAGGGEGNTAQPEGLAMNPDFWRTIFDAIEVPLFLHDAQFRVLLANHAYCRAAGMTEVEAQGKPYWEVFPRGTGPLPGCKNSMIGTGHTASREEVSAGDKLFLSTSYTVHDEQGNVLYDLHILSDITAQRQSEDALRNSKDMLQYVVENVPARIFWKDRDSRYLGCNTQFAQDAGRSSPDELTGKTDFEMGWKDQAELYRADDKAVMESGTPKLDIEEPQTTLDGNTIWLRASKVPLRDESKQVVGVLGIYQDVTASKQSDAALKNESLRRRILMECSRDGIAIINQRHQVVEANPRFAEMLGYTPEEMLGLHTWDFEAAMTKAEIQAKFANLMNTSMITETRHRRKDGTVYDVEVSIGGAIVDDEPMVFTVSRDITERKQAEALLQQERDFFDGMVETAQVIILVLNPEGQIVRFNHYMETLTGYSLNEVKGQDWFSTFLPEPEREKTRELFLGAIQNIQTRGNVNALLTKDGQQRLIEWYDKTLKDAEGNTTGLLSVGLDVTERKRAESLQRKSEEKFRLLFESSRDALMVLAPPSWKFTSANAATLQMFGVASVTEFTALGPWDVSPERQPDGLSSAEKAQEMIATAMREGSHFFEWVHQRIGGASFAADVLLTRVEVEGQVSVQATVRDITERKQAEQLIQDEKTFSDSLILSLPDFFYLIDHQGSLLRWSRKGEELLGLSPEEMSKANVLAFIHEADKPLITHKIQEAFKTGSAEAEARLLMKKGTRHYILTATRIETRRGVNVIGVGVDITERKQAEANLAEQLEELRRWHDATLGREMRILELKHEVNELLGQAGQPPRYPSAESPEQKEE